MGKSLDGSPVRHLTIYFFLAQRCIQLKLRALQTITISFVSLTGGGGICGRSHSSSISGLSERMYLFFQAPKVKLF